MHLSIWDEQFWLPDNITWKDFNELEQTGIRIPKIHDLIYVYPLAGLLYMTRVIFEYYVAQPLGRLVGIHDYQSNIQRIDRKSNHFKLSAKKQHKHCMHVSRLAKFSESAWRFTFYLSIFLYGITILKNVRWQCLVLFPEIRR